MPGVLPVPNDEALRLTVLTGYLLNCEIPRFAKFDRKSYFYPDAPKNYQLTQYDKPSTQNGFVEFEFTGAVRQTAWAASASPARIWKKTSASSRISTATAAWISTAPACRSWKSFPSRTSPARTWPTNISTRSRTF
jgi:aspartyl-tRNA(Asn)/glutamyl-tRNA(Gln) amidotransferase subunit B